VTDPGQANPTNSMTFTIIGSVPVLSSIQPNSAQGGPSATDVNITLTGNGFNAGSQVQFDGSVSGVTTTFSSATSLSAVISHTLLAFGGVHGITVVNPLPGGGPSSSLPLTVISPGLPVNDNFANATVVKAVPFTDAVDNSSATTETTDPTPPCITNSTNPRTKTVWYVYTSGGNGPVTIDTIGSSYDTTLSVWTAVGGAGASLQFANVACNDDIIRGVVTQSQLTFSASAGITYYVMIASFGPPDPLHDQAGGKTVIHVTTSVNPSALSAAPVLGTVTAGSPTSFAVSNTPQPGVNATFTLTCSGLPSGASCGQASVGPNATATLTITTTMRSTIPPWSPETRNPRPMHLPWVGIPVSLLIMSVLTMLAVQRRRVISWVPVTALVLTLLMYAAGCQGSGGGNGGGVTGTPAGIYPIVVTGTSGPTSEVTLVILKVN
jgi:hypothetical protein